MHKKQNQSHQSGIKWLIEVDMSLNKIQTQSLRLLLIKFKGGGGVFGDYQPDSKEEVFGDYQPDLKKGILGGYQRVSKERIFGCCWPDSKEEVFGCCWPNSKEEV